MWSRRSMEVYIAIVVVLIHIVHINLFVSVSANTASVHVPVPTPNDTEKVQHFRLFRRSADEISQGVTASQPHQSTPVKNFMKIKSKSDVKVGQKVQHRSTSTSAAYKGKANAYDKYLKKPYTRNEKLSRSKRTIIFLKFKKFVKFLFLLG